jgi:PEGA domain
MSRAHPRMSWFCAGLCVWLLCACAAKRTLTVVTDPPGATLRIDDRVVGSTPYTEEFYDYGTRRITLYKAGYRSQSVLVELKPPWYARFPVDIFTEVLFPWGWKDPHTQRLVLEPVPQSVTAPDLEKVLEKAESLRLSGPEGPSQLAPRKKPSTTVSEPKP